MSTRAYKLIKIKTKKKPTFNISQEYDWLNAYSNLDESTIYFSKDQIDEAIIEESGDNRKIEILNAILKDMGKDEEVEYISY